MAFALQLKKKHGKPSFFLSLDIGGVKMKVKFTIEQSTKAQKGSRFIAILFL
jgi:hypothetical protein